jgi:hypothetical protein
VNKHTKNDTIEGVLATGSTEDLKSADMPTQELKTKAEWLEKRISESVSKVKQRANASQKKASYIKILLFVLSGSATILLGIQITGLDKLFKDIAFVFTALVTLMAGVEPFFNFRGLWIEHERAEYKFHLLRDDLDFYLAGIEPEDLSIEKLNHFQERFQEIWSNLSKVWLDQREGQRYNL